jgi:multiple antibiotic resistance protein
MSITYEALALFLALVGLYSPIAALSSYLPVLRPFGHAAQVRLAAGLTVNVAVFVLAAIWIGDPLLELLGISPAALTATGGIALILAAVPMMRGTVPPPPEEPGEPPAKPLFTPLTFPLTVGGATFAIGAATSADAGNNTGRLWLSLAAVAYGLVTGLTLYAAGHVERRASPEAGRFLDRIAGILLTCIAVILLANGFTDLVLARAGRG